MSNFNVPINVTGFVDTLSESKQTAEDIYINDRAAYMKGRSGEDVEYSTQREQEMHMMGTRAYERFGR